MDGEQEDHAGGADTIDTTPKRDASRGASTAKRKPTGKRAGGRTARGSAPSSAKVSPSVPPVSGKADKDRDLAVEAAGGVATMVSFGVELVTPDMPLTDQESDGVEFSMGLLASRWPSQIIAMLSIAAVLFLAVVLGVIVFRRVRHARESARSESSTDYAEYAA